MERGEADLGRVLPMNFPPSHTICFTLSDLDVLVFLEVLFRSFCNYGLDTKISLVISPGAYGTGGLFQNHVAIGTAILTVQIYCKYS